MSTALFLTVAEPPPSDSTRTDRALPMPGRATLAIFGLTLLGFVLRLAAARGDLWLDEIWSFAIVAKATSLSDVFLALPYDNNHVLNSAWLKIVGPSAPFAVARLPAVLLGTLCVPLAAKLGARISPAASICLAAIFAVGFPFVQFGSEARGYSGLVAAFLVALDAMEARLSDETSVKSLAIFAVAIGFGTFSQPLMLEATGLLCATFAVRCALAERSVSRSIQQTVPVLLTASLGILPPLACFIVSLGSGPLHIGLSTPFAALSFAEGFGAIVRATLGLWPATLPQTVSALLLGAVGLVVIICLVGLGACRRVLPVLGLFVLPALHAAVHLPNQYYARYHLLSAACLALFLGEFAAQAWCRPRTKSVALIASCAFVVGQCAQLVPLIADGRGQFEAASQLVLSRQPTSLAVVPTIAGPETAAVVRWYARREGRNADVVLVSADLLCTSRVEWLIAVHRPDDATYPGDEARLRQAACANRYKLAQRFRSYGMSGFDWTVLRRRHDGG